MRHSLDGAAWWWVLRPLVEDLPFEERSSTHRSARRDDNAWRHGLASESTGGRRTVCVVLTQSWLGRDELMTRLCSSVCCRRLSMTVGRVI